MSLGIVDLKSGTKPIQFPALHLRMIVTNQSQGPWRLSTRDQKVQLMGKGASIPPTSSPIRKNRPKFRFPPAKPARSTFSTCYRKGSKRPSLSTALTFSRGLWSEKSHSYERFRLSASLRAGDSSRCM